MTTPPQRPVLRRAPDADLSPAAPPGTLAAARGHAQESGGSDAARDASGATDGAKGSKGASKKKKRKKHTSKRAGDVRVEIELPERLVRRLDERAHELGHSRRRTLELLVQAWLDG